MIGGAGRAMLDEVESVSGAPGAGLLPAECGFESWGERSCFGFLSNERDMGLSQDVAAATVVESGVLSAALMLSAG